MRGGGGGAQGVPGFCAAGMLLQRGVLVRQSRSQRPRLVTQCETLLSEKQTTRTHTRTEQKHEPCSRHVQVLSQSDAFLGVSLER